MSKVTLKENNKWIIQEEEFQVHQNKHFEGVFTTGNGYLSIRGSLEERLKDENQAEEYMRMPMNVTLEKSNHMISKWGTYVPGVVGEHPLLKEVMVNLPWMLEWRMWFNDEPFNMDSCIIREYNRHLNMQEGTLKRSFIWQSEQGDELELMYERFVSMDCDHLSVQQIQVKLRKGNGILKIAAGINANVRTNGFNHYKSIKTSINDGYIQTEIMTDKGHHVVQGSIVSSDRPDDWIVKEESSHIYYETEINLKENEKLEFTKLSAIATNRDLHGQNPFHTVKDTLMQHGRMNYDELKKKNADAWAKLWQSCDIRIRGNDQLQKSIRFSLYHLLRSNVRKDSRVAIDAKGHAGEAYFGRYFWDTEIYLLPFFIYSNPEAAKNLVLYRYNTLKGARQNAANYGYKGARYAWESGLTGVEQCPNWQYADHEVHITADVAYGLWHYYKATNDIRFLIDYGFEVLIETARYWVSRVYKNASGDFDLSGVMGPDEYSPFSKNNAFTNYAVKFNLEKVLEAARFIYQAEPDNYTLLVNKVNLTKEELYQFERIMDGLPIPMDEKRNLILQSEDFDSFENIDFQEVWKDRTKPFGHFVSQEKMYRSKCLKQADVLTLMMVFPDRFTAAQMKAAYEYYEPITTHDSSLSPCTHSIIASWIRNREDAERFFLKAVEIDLELKKLGSAEGIHIANSGGVWQAIVHGFAGIRNTVQSEKLTLNPLMPRFAEEISFPFNWKGSSMIIVLKQDGIKVKNKGNQSVEIVMGEKDFSIPPAGILDIQI